MLNYIGNLKAGVFTAIWMSLTVSVQASDLIASLAYLPELAESPNSGILVELVKAIDELHPDEVTVTVHPFPQSIDNIKKGLTDFHMPILKNPSIPDSALPYLHSTENIFQVYFALYTHKDSPVTKQALEEAPWKFTNIVYARLQNLLDKKTISKLRHLENRQFDSTEALLSAVSEHLGKRRTLLLKDVLIRAAFPYTIETDSAHTHFFSIPVAPSRDPLESLSKLDRGDIDGYIFAARESELTINRLNLKNLQSQLYNVYDVKIIFPRNFLGQLHNSLVSDYISKLKANGQYDKIMGDLIKFYREWKPTKEIAR